MLRAASWTAGLFVAGSAVCRFIPGSYVEPLVLMALGSALLLLSGRSGRGRTRAPHQAREPREAA